MRIKIIITAAVAIVVAIGFLIYGNLIITGDIASSKELLGRHYGIAEVMMQKENTKYLVTTDNEFYPTISKIQSPWCGYKLLIVTGIRYDECKKADIVAALIPTKALPFWCLFGKMPPALVMHPDLGVREMGIGDVPLRLGWR